MGESLFQSPDGVAQAPIAEPDLQLIVDTVPGLVSYVDRNCRFVFTNRRYAEWFGRPQNDFVGKHLSDVIGADAFLAIKPHVEKAFAGETATFDRHHRYDSGPPRYVKTTIVPDLASGGYVKGVVVLVEDISDRKRAEDAERDLERQLTLLIEASGSLLASPITADVLRTILDVAKRFIEADAYSVWRREGETWHMAASEGLSASYNSAAAGVPQALVAARLPIVTEDVEKDPFVASRREAHKAEGIQSLITVPLQIQNEVAGTLVFYYRKRHGFTMLETRVASALGNLAAAAIGSADLYQRQSELRQRAESNEQRAAFLAEAGQILSSSLDFDQTLSALVELAVPRFADVAAVEVLDQSGQNRRVALKHCDPSKLDFVKDFRRRFPPLADDVAVIAMQTGQSVLIENIPDEVLVERARTPEHLEALRYFGTKSLILAPLIANNHKFGLLSFVTTQSGRHYGQADLKFAEELARRAATAMDHARLFAESNDAQNALRRSNAELSRVNEDLNQFAYSASHDLQEPLRMLVIYSQLLNRKYRHLLDGQANEYLGFIVEGAKRMEMLLGDLLAYMQVVDVAQLPDTAVDSNAALKQVLEVMAMSISDSGAIIDCEDLPPLAVQQFHIIQLFQNLIGNAIKYRTDEPPHIRITCNRDGSYWKICVADNGIGIPPEYRDQVFKVFKRLHEKDKYPGTGIGLAICQKIVERYGGSIWIESGEDTGSTICITLPIIEIQPALAKN